MEQILSPPLIFHCCWSVHCHSGHGASTALQCCLAYEVAKFPESRENRASFSPLLTPYIVHRVNFRQRIGMSLCNLCLTVPFLSLPSPPSLSSSGLLVNEETKEGSFDSEADIQNEAGEIRPHIGFPFHRDLHALERSAKTCPLCQIVQAGVRKWIDLWNDAATNNEFFIEHSKSHSPIPNDQQLWLTACSSRAQGFYVWAQVPTRKSSAYLLTAVGFSVESSQYFDVSHICSVMPNNCLQKIA